MTKLSGSLPEEHGLADINDIAIQKPETPFFVIGVVVPSKITKDLWKKREEATVAFESIEVLTGKDAERALDMLRAAQEKRTGDVALPFEDNPPPGGNVHTFKLNTTTGELEEDNQ